MQVRTLVILGALALVACDKGGDAGADKSGQADDPHAAFTNLSVEDVEGMVSGKNCVAVDANNGDTRKEYGIVPGAVLLSSHDSFKPEELPSDKATKLVFYCGSEKCTAAPKAAELAQQAGYRDVAVMGAGIRGWVKAGNKVDQPPS
jgi:rhodanese-related sulfurtransferase